jgi:hypothetical protein
VKVTQNFKGVFNRETKLWEFDMSLTTAISKALKDDSPDIKINPIPSSTSSILLMEIPQHLEVREGRKNILKTISYTKDDVDINPKSLPFYEGLYAFQRDAVEFAVKHFGRVLIAD